MSDNKTQIKTGQGEMQKTEFGALRESNDGRGRFDLIPYEAMEALAKWYEAGAGKYEERNWEKGISVKDCINRMIRHSLKAGNGWIDEDHLAAVMWNAAAAITMMQRKPECNDHVWGGVNASLKQVSETRVLYNHVPLKNDIPTIMLSEDDVTFLTIALKSGGINDIEKLAEWINRRRPRPDKTKTRIGKLRKTCNGCLFDGENCTSEFPCERDENGFLTGYCIREED